jgi:alkyl sulfatase BDS1-like metallo-beta-lactamase superfamily hydrolase
VLALGSWASRAPSFPLGAPMGADSLVLALKSAFQTEKADGLDATYGLWLGELPFNIAVKEGKLEASRGEAERPGATIRSDPAAIASVVFGGNRLGKAVESGAVAIDGDRRAVNALFRALT